MDKLKLHLDELAVESFDTCPVDREKGTVFGEQQPPCTCPTLCTCPGCPTCDATCPQTCDDFTCAVSCEGTCVASCESCHATCWDTCGRTCLCVE